MRRFQRLKVPEKAHPLVRQLLIEMNREMIGLSDLAERSGIAMSTLRGWRTRRNPRVNDLEACFNALGKRLIVAHLPDISGVTNDDCLSNS